MTVLASFAFALAAQGRLPVVLLDRDDLVVRESCILEPGAAPIVDDEGDGIVQIVTDGITVTFTRTVLRGAPSDAPLDSLRGVGVRVRARNVTVQGLQASGLRAAVWASDADGLVVEGCELSGNFAHRLRSTSAAEDLSDWLWPHENDGNEWLTSYGAALYVESSKGVTLRRNRARRGQNGICLRAVDDSLVYDNDMSFLSGWGLALYRSSRNKIARNSFDFCIRGYSHGVYARGQDSAGILLFEQSSDNTIALNSATHGGDGLFGFAGNDALEHGERAGVGCNRNLIYGNDFSYAAAIGIELTFSFDNLFARNRLIGSNYGVWGGYSARTQVRGNELAENTLAGIAVEHGSGWVIAGNTFARNARAVELWWDDDAELMSKPWARVNSTDSGDHVLRLNRFDSDGVQLEVRGPTQRVSFDPAQEGADRSRWRVDEDASVLEAQPPLLTTPIDEAAIAALPGTRKAVGARKALEGRDRIVMTEWGPYDWVAPFLQRLGDRGGEHVWRLLGNEVPIAVDAGPQMRVRMDTSVDPALYLLSPRKAGDAVEYELRVRVPTETLTARALALGMVWDVTCGSYTTDPRSDAAAWRSEVSRGVSTRLSDLKLRYGNDGPSQLGELGAAVGAASLPRERFGTLASARITLPGGLWRVVTRSDDGVRVRVDGRTVIDNWTHHGPTTDSAVVGFDALGKHTLEVEHFELDGFAVLEVDLERAP